MLESYEIENIEQLRAIADMLRLRIFEMLQNKPMTVTQLGEELGEAPAKVHYHVRELERVGLLRLVETREKGGILEKYYQPIAREISVEKSLLSAPPAEALAMIGRIWRSYLLKISVCMSISLAFVTLIQTWMQIWQSELLSISILLAI